MLRFEPFRSRIEQSFWFALSRKKLDEIKLDEEPFDIWSKLDPGSPIVSLDESSLQEPGHRLILQGRIQLFNKIEDFKAFPKMKFLNDAKESLLDGSYNYDFIMLVFGDLKRFRFYYHFCFPALVAENPFELAEELCSDVPYEPPSERVVRRNDGCYLVIDPAKDEFGWPLRNFLARIKSDQVEIVAVKKKSLRHIRVNIPKEQTFVATGWEKNNDGKAIPQCVDLSVQMNPVLLAKEASELNLKLIKWRVLPNLDLEAVSSMKCLLFGAGTLGCNAARCLMGWGVNRISFVDSGTVSHSNPVRQSLFRFEDVGKLKAIAAAERLREIDPSISTQGVSLTIPMPGHLILDEKQMEMDVTDLEKLVQSHDVLFLLTDSRESRWLPTVLGAYYGKIVITIALGFDSFVAMRHGERRTKAPSSRLGCYFCSDVSSPSNTMESRTLDQQCTVTRPGLPYIAAASGVELLCSVLQHPQRNSADACTAAHPTEAIKEGSLLGAVPHQIRGFLSHFQNLLLVGESYEHCAGCSKSVLEALEENGIVLFVKNVLADEKFLKKVTGSVEESLLLLYDDAYQSDF